jgi:hypothetical protein
MLRIGVVANRLAWYKHAYESRSALLPDAARTLLSLTRTPFHLPVSMPHEIAVKLAAHLAFPNALNAGQVKVKNLPSSEHSPCNPERT